MNTALFLSYRRWDPLFGPADYPCTEKCPEWQSGLEMSVFYFRQVLGNRSYCATFDHIFSDYEYSDLESEIADFAGRKTGLHIPFWMADLSLDPTYHIGRMAPILDSRSLAVNRQVSLKRKET